MDREEEEEEDKDVKDSPLEKQEASSAAERETASAPFLKAVSLSAPTVLLLELIVSCVCM